MHPGPFSKHEGLETDFPHVGASVGEASTVHMPIPQRHPLVRRVPAVLLVMPHADQPAHGSRCLRSQRTT
eukprot:363897-Chlamydomonas_euryale.AAC.7